ncbi:unnamed protein product, partial [Prorocentrum cordatum]
VCVCVCVPTSLCNGAISILPSHDQAGSASPLSPAGPWGRARPGQGCTGTDPPWALTLQTAAFGAPGAPATGQWQEVALTLDRESLQVVLSLDGEVAVPVGGQLDGAQGVPVGSVACSWDQNSTNSSNSTDSSNSTGCSALPSVSSMSLLSIEVAAWPGATLEVERLGVTAPAGHWQRLLDEAPWPPRKSQGGMGAGHFRWSVLLSEQARLSILCLCPCAAAAAAQRLSREVGDPSVAFGVSTAGGKGKGADLTPRTHAMAVFSMMVSLPVLPMLVIALVFTTCAAIEDIWLFGIEPYTIVVPVGLSVQIGKELMLDEINKKADLLPGYRLRMAHQDGQCSADCVSNMFLRNLFKDTYEVFAPGVDPLTLNRDGVGAVSYNSSSIFNEVWTSANMSGGPVGLIGGGCSGGTMAINNVAYMANVPIVSALSSNPELSDRSKYPNFWRTVMPDTQFAGAWMATTKVLGFSDMTVVIGETSVWTPHAASVLRQSEAHGVALKGVDLSEEFEWQGEPLEGFAGYQVSINSVSAAFEAAKGIRQPNRRIVLTMMYDDRLRMLFCECHKLGLDNFIFMGPGWLGDGFWRTADDTECSIEQVTHQAKGWIVADARFWRSDMNTKLTCLDDMTAADFQAKWLESQRINLTTFVGITKEGILPTHYGAVAADAVCMFALMLHTVLFKAGHSMEDLMQRKTAVYNEIQEIFNSTDFEGNSGRIRFEPNSPDYVDIGEYNIADGVLTFLGVSDFEFKMPGEIYAAGLVGAASLAGQPVAFDTCPHGMILNYASNVCVHCGDSEVFVDTLGGCTCKAGFVSSTEGCVPCEAGTYVDVVGQNACIDCETRRFSDEGGATACERCPRGSFANSTGRASCTDCPHKESGKTTGGLGSESEEDCQCGVGFKPVASDGSCETCGEEDETGLVCLGNDVVEVAAGFYAADESLSVFRCYGNDPTLRCRGGLAGQTCAPGRAGISCSECQEGSMPKEDGSCVPCEAEGNSSTALVLVVAALLVGLSALYGVIDRFNTAKYSYAMLLPLVGSILVTIVQQLAVLGAFKAVTWPAPMTGFLLGLELGTLDVEFLNLGCVGQISPLGRFIVKLSILAVCVFVILMIHVVSVLVFYKGRFSDRLHILIACLGSCVTVFYISVISAVLGPIQCLKNPNGKWAARPYPSVVCWESDEHSVMVAIGAIVLLIPIGYLVQCCLTAWRFPRMMSEDHVSYLQSYAFLFFRYKPETYWYCLVQLLRSLLLAVVLALPDVAFQLMSMQLILALQLCCVVYYLPWRVPGPNTLDATFTVGVVVVLACASFYVDAHPGDVLAWLSIVLVAIMLCSMPVIGAVVLYRELTLRDNKPFKFFICHDMAGAGAYARLLKMHMEKRAVRVGIDNACAGASLDTIMDQVGTQTERLIVLASKGLIQRHSSMNMIMTAKRKQVQVAKVTMPEYTDPEEEFINSYETYFSDLSVLANSGFTVSNVKDAPRWFHGLQGTPVSRQLTSTSLEEICNELIGKDAPPASEAGGDPPPDIATFIVHDSKNLEATATAMVLERMLEPSFGAGKSPRVLSAGQPAPSSAKQVILLCADGVLEQEAPLRTITSASKLGATFLPVLAGDGFRFPPLDNAQNNEKILEQVEMDVVLAAFKPVSVSFPAAFASDQVLRVISDRIAARLFHEEWTKSLLESIMTSENQVPDLAIISSR